MWGSPNDGYIETNLQEKMKMLNDVIDSVPWNYEVNVAELNQAIMLFNNLGEFLSHFKEK